MTSQQCHTFITADDLADIPLPESRPDSPASNPDYGYEIESTDDNSYETITKTPPGHYTWRYAYESSFCHKKADIAFLEKAIVENIGCAG